MGVGSPKNAKGWWVDLKLKRSFNPSAGVKKSRKSCSKE